jgi:hypothetical protein
VGAGGLRLEIAGMQRIEGFVQLEKE